MGATITAIIYEYAPLKPKKRDNKEDMTNTLFQADEVRDEVEYEDDDDDDNENGDGEGDGSPAGGAGAEGEAAGGALPTDDDLMDDI